MSNRIANSNITTTQKAFFKFSSFLFPIILAVLSNQIKASINAFEYLGIDSSWAWSLGFYIHQEKL